MRAPSAGARPIAGRDVARWLLAAIYLVAGVFHLATPDPFLLITPGWVPFPRAVILATGVCEIAGALGLLGRRLRWAAGVALALYAVLVFPANIQHALTGVPEMAPGLWYHLPRLAFQPVLVWWALFAGGVVDWPFGGGRDRPPSAGPIPPARGAATR